MIKLSSPYLPESAYNHVMEVLRSGNLVQGSYVAKFEASLEKYLGVKHAVLVSSGTAALHLSLVALGIKQGDEVIVPAFTFPATANVVELVGAKPIFVDIKLNDFCIDCSRIEEKITNRTRAIIPVHEFGQAVDMNALLEVARKYELDIIEDAACALGTEFESKKTGTFGLTGCFSFHPRKTITTGEGGAIVTNDDVVAEKLRSLRNHGMMLQGGKLDFLYAGFNYRMTDFQAALGVSQLASYEEIMKRRIEIADLYDKVLGGRHWIKLPTRYVNRKMVFQTYHVLLSDAVDRGRLISSLREAGIETNFGAHAVICLKYFREKYDFREEDYPNAVKAYRQGLALPMGPHLSNGDIETIAEKLYLFADRHGFQEA